MADIYLQGSETVDQAARTMRAAAEEIGRHIGYFCEAVSDLRVQVEHFRIAVETLKEMQQARSALAAAEGGDDE